MSNDNRILFIDSRRRILLQLSLNSEITAYIIKASNSYVCLCVYVHGPFLDNFDIPI